MKTSLLFSILILLSFLATNAEAAINRRGISAQLIADFYAVKSREVPLDASLIIPMDMQPTNNASTVFTRMADKGLSAFVNSADFKASSLGRTSAEVQEKMQTEMVVGGNEPQSTQHKFNFNFQVFQAMAQIKYTGFTNVTLNYKPAAAEMNLEVSEKLDSSKDLVFDHIAAADHRLSQVSVRWTF